ncbi:MAG: pyrimidine 5'-nucleotidase [Rubellimicrobium sp.]|nr:pyrimidine 5'-nucleotidase [Rubellimicrobium sp.]
MSAASFAQVRTWVFDLDNTLYPPSAALFAQIGARMNAWLMQRFGVDQAEAARLRDDYWDRYGTTLAGLVAEHRIDPMAFLAEVHDIDFAVLTPDPALARAIDRLPGRRIVFTNGDSAYAARVLAARGLTGAFDSVYGAEHASFISKPMPEAFARVFALEGLAPRESAMFEDDARNLSVPHGLGMRTVLVGADPATGAHIHHRTGDLTGFLGAVMPRPAFPAGGPHEAS